MPQTRIERLPLSVIVLTAKNPRRDAAAPDLAGLAASLGPEEAPTLAQLPVVEEVGNGTYRVIAGERRIRAARLAGWETIACVVRPPLDPFDAHRLRVVENLHRKELHPLDQAIALKLTWYSANAQAMGLDGAASVLLDKEQPPGQTLADLETLLKEQGFVPSHPVISWDETLDGLGVAFDKERRKKLLQVLGVAQELQGQIRQLDMTEASLRALAKLEPEDQARLVEEMAEDPDLARKVRRISHAVRTHDYGVDEAIAEARGMMPGITMSEENLDGIGEEETANPLGDGEATETGIEYFSDEVLADLVVHFMDAAHVLKSILKNLRKNVGETPLSDLPAPWGEYAQSSMQAIRDTVHFWADEHP